MWKNLQWITLPALQNSSQVKKKKKQKQHTKTNQKQNDNRDKFQESEQLSYVDPQALTFAYIQG